ncbi:MAG: hypothetical protein ABS36_11240 [Acidobacteria bacterium SCN 69-37]|nr:MAG: hypothetical protein ABS36_11240 [Acidobacteria bacterium SCN 69-37]
MTITPTISVVIPCRDAEAWLAETLASVRSQEDVALEVIVVDDGSTDGSAAVAERFGVIVERGPARGVSAARNAGTARARGTFVLYLDADDVLLPGTLRERLDAIERDEADVALSAWTRWERQDDGGFVETETVRRRMGARPDAELLAGAWWPPGSLLYRRTIVDLVGGWRTDLPIIQDARFLLDAVLAGARLTYVDTVAMRYRVHGVGSLSRRDPEAFIDDCYRSAADLHDRWQRDGTLDAERRRALLVAFGHTARAWFPIDRARFEQSFNRLMALDPRYLPDGPPALRALSRAIGYRRAERVASWWRRIAAVWR